MPYHKNKQQAYQAAEQGVEEVKDAFFEIVKDSADYGKQLKHLKNEINEALEQIDNALEVASETQRVQLEKLHQDVLSIAQEIEKE